MRYNVPGAVAPAGRLLADPRRWLMHAARRSAAGPGQWARGVSPRRAAVVAAIAGAALGAGLAGQTARYAPAGYANAIEIVDNGAPPAPAGTLAAGSTPLPAGSLPASAAESSLSQLARPGYALSTAAAAALTDVRATVSDAVVLQQLRAEILAPAPTSGLSGMALSDLVSLVRQAQVSSQLPAAQAASVPAAPAVPPLDSSALAQAESDVRAAQAALAEATKARDEARTAGPAAAANASSTPAASAATSVTAAASATASAPTAAAKPADPAVIHDAEARLVTAQQQLQALLAGPSPDVVKAAQQAVADALAAVPQAPGEGRIADAKAAVDRAQKDYDAANQPASAPAQAVTRSAASVPVAPVNRSASVERNQGAVPAPVAADPAPRPDDTTGGGGLTYGVAAQRVAETRASLDSAKASLAVLEQQAAAAASPESQPAVIEARKRLAQVAAPPDPASVAAARAVVTSTQQQVISLQSQGVTAVATPPLRVNVATPAPPVAAATSLPAVASQPQAAPTVAANATATASQPADPVAAAEQRLTEAQKRLRDIIVSPALSAVPATGVPAAAGTSAGPGPVAATALPASLPPLVTVPPAGSTATQTSPDVLAAQARLAASGQVSSNDLTAVEIGLRAQYVADAVLKVERLHPSALPISPVAAAVRPGSISPSAALAWPVYGPITQAFGVPELGVGAPHAGIDIGVAIGTPVLASASGIVTFAGGEPATGYGYYAIVDHGGVSTLYAHLALPPLVHPGQFLPQKGLIGLSGTTGMSTGPHVHFELRLSGTPVDPLQILLAGTARPGLTGGR